MAEQKILISIQINDSQAKKTNKALKVTKDNFDKLTDSEIKGIVADKQKVLSSKAVDKALTQQAAATNLAAKSTDNMRATSGLNNAIIMETSRLASDASFGFTAIANNLSQLVNLVQMNTKATGSFSKAIGGLFTAQAAFLIGIQLLITYGADLAIMLKDLIGSSLDLSKVFKDAGNNVRETAGRFETYIATLQDSNASQEKQAKAVQLLNKEFPEYIDELKKADVSIEDVKNQTEEATKVNDEYRDSILKLARSRAAQSAIEEEAAEMISKEIETTRKLQDKYNLSLKEARKISEDYNDEQEKSTTIILGQGMVTQDTYNARNAAIDALVRSMDKEVAKRKENVALLENFVILQDKETELIRNRNRIFKAADLDFEKETQKSRERLLKGFIKDEEAQIRLKFSGIKERARLKQKEFQDDQQRRLNEYLAVETDEAKKLDAIKRFNNEIAKSKESLTAYEIQLDDEATSKIAQSRIKESQEIQESNREKLDAEAAYLDEKNRMNGNYSFFQNERNIETLTMDVAAQQKIVDSHAVGTLEREQAELRLFELKKRLNSEEQSLAEQKFQFFNQQYTAITDALSQTFSVSAENETIALEESYGRRIAAAEGDAETQERLQQELAKKKDDIARKQFKIDKAMKIGRALMDTYQSGILAFGSQLIVGDPTSPLRARIAQGVALATGLANVANIARQKYQSSLGAGGGAGAGGGGTTIQAPDFNVVGASQTSQLAETVAGQQAKPVKAFVVGKDISTQQELDRNITNTASFG